MKNKPYIVLGAVDAITAYRCSRMGADYIWASSFVMSTMLGLKDDGIINIKNFLLLISGIIKGSKNPVILDLDIGGRSKKELEKNLETLKSLNMGGICIEDEKWPKVNAMLKSSDRYLISPNEMVFKINTAKKILDPKCLVIARTHSLIAKEPLSLLQKRINDYTKAGADVLCIHYRGDSWNFYQKTIDNLIISKPLMVIFSKINFVPKFLLSNPKIKFILFPNQIYRVMLYPVISISLRKNLSYRGFKSINAKIISIQKLFKLINKINAK